MFNVNTGTVGDALERSWTYTAAVVAEYAPTASTISKSYRLVNTAEGLRDLAARLKSAGRFALRVLPDRPSAMLASVVGFAFSTSPRDADYLPVGHRALGESSSMPIAAVVDALRPVFEDAAVPKVGHDLKFDAVMLARLGVTLRGLDLDTMIASYLVDATRSAHRIEDLALEHTSYKALTEEDVCGRGAKALSLAELPPEAEPVFERLRAWRTSVAKELGMPPYVIFHDATLRLIAASPPSTLDELRQVNGVGATKLEKYGQAILDVLADKS